MGCRSRAQLQGGPGGRQEGRLRRHCGRRHRRRLLSQVFAGTRVHPFQTDRRGERCRHPRARVLVHHCTALQPIWDQERSGTEKLDLFHRVFFGSPARLGTERRWPRPRRLQAHRIADPSEFQVLQRWRYPCRQSVRLLDRRRPFSESARPRAAPACQRDPGGHAYHRARRFLHGRQQDLRFVGRGAYLQRFGPSLVRVGRRWLRHHARGREADEGVGGQRGSLQPEPRFLAQLEHAVSQAGLQRSTSTVPSTGCWSKG